MLTAHQEDLLQAAFGAGESAVRSWRRWRDSVNWDAHLDRDSFRLMPRLSRHLHSLGVDDPLLPRLKGIARQAWYANQRIVAQWQPLLRALEAASVEPLLVTPATLFLLDARPVLEPGAPITLAVRREDAERAIRCLSDRRWHASVRIPRWSLAGYVMAGQRLSWWNSDGQAVDLLWQSDRSDVMGRFPGEMWERTVRARLANVPVLAPDVTDAIHDFCRQPLMGHLFPPAVDLLLIMDGLPGEIDWPRLAARAARAPLAFAWRDGFAELRRVLPVLFSQSALIEWPEERRSAAGPSRGDLQARVGAHWATYRQALGTRASITTMVRQLPGYLLARWNLPAWQRIPMRLFRGLRWEWRDARLNGK